MYSRLPSVPVTAMKSPCGILRETRLLLVLGAAAINVLGLSRETESSDGSFRLVFLCETPSNAIQAR